MASERIYVKKSMWTNGKLQDNTFKPFCKTTSIDPVMQILADRSQYCKPKSLSISEHERTEYMGKSWVFYKVIPVPWRPILQLMFWTVDINLSSTKNKKQKRKKKETHSYRFFQNRINPCICGLWSPFINPIIAALQCLAWIFTFLPRAFVRCVYDSNYIQTIILNDPYDRST